MNEPKSESGATTSRDQPTQEKRFVLVDTSIWRSQLLLRSPLGAALLYYIRRTEALLALPEVVELEMAKHVKKAVAEARTKAEASFATLQQVMKVVAEFDIPNDEQVEEAIRDRLAELADITERVPFTLEHARRGLMRVIEDTPPNAPKHQQFKDSAIWEAALSLAAQRPVLFITGDNGFFQGKDPAKGVAIQLQKEIAGGARISVFFGIEPCLATMKDESPSFDNEQVAAQVKENLVVRINEYLAEQGLVASEASQFSINVFATEHPTRVTLAVHAEYPLSDTGADEPAPPYCR